MAETRQELSTALYYNDSAQRVIARLQKERDEARDALSRVSVTAAPNGTGQANGDAMQVDGQGLPQDVLGKIDATQAKLSATRRKRPVPEDWATGDEIAAYDVKSKADTQFTGAKSLAVDETGDFFLTGDSDGTVGIYDLKQDAFTTRSNLSAGGINHGAWARDSAVVATASGAVVVTQEGAVKAKFQQHAGAATAVAAHPSGELLASVGVDKSLVLYDLQHGKVLTQIFSDAGKFIHWRCRGRRKTVTDIFTALTSTTFHPDGHLLAAGAADGSIELYDVKTCQLAHTFPSPAGATPVADLNFSENGTWLASAYEGSTTVTVWDLRKLSALKTLEVGGAVTGISWDYTGQFLAACGPGGVTVAQYTKASKSWTEPLRKGVSGAQDVKWGANAKKLVTLTSDGAVNVLAA